jgi:hypothetical protein
MSGDADAAERQAGRELEAALRKLLARRRRARAAARKREFRAGLAELLREELRQAGEGA